MNKLAKKLYYKFFDLYQYSSFLGSREQMDYAKTGMRIIKENPEIDFGTISETELLYRGYPKYIVDCIIEYRLTQNIRSIAEFGSSIDDWIHDIIFPGFVDNSIIGEIIRSNNVTNRNELLRVIASDGFISKYGQEVSANYLYFIEATDWSEYPTKYIGRYRVGDDMITHLGNCHIYGNFHNHTNYSDGNNSLQELVELAMKHDRQYIGIYDHSYSAHGVDEAQLELQLREIQTLNQTFKNIAIFRSLECEILSNWKNRSRLGQCAGADWDTFDAAKLMIFSETVAF